MEQYAYVPYTYMRMVFAQDRSRLSGRFIDLTKRKSLFRIAFEPRNNQENLEEKEKCGMNRESVE